MGKLNNFIVSSYMAQILDKVPVVEENANRAKTGVSSAEN